MSADQDLSVVLGAGGGIGAAVVHELAARGAAVRAVGRRPIADLPDGVAQTNVDVATADGARTAVAGAAVVYHCAQPAYTRWAQEFPALNETVADATAAVGAKLVFADNLYMYGPIDGPIAADDPQQPDSRKGAVRKRIAAALLARDAAGSLRVTLGRASDYYGPGGRSSAAGDALFNAALAGKTYRYPATLDTPHTFHYLPDIAKGLVTLGADDRADGRAWVLPAAEPLTARQLAALVYEAAGQPLAVSAVPRPLARAVGIAVPTVREIVDIWTQFSRPFTTDSAAFDQQFAALQPTPHSDAISVTVAWFRDA
jgi:nucleoside-diphosphate-sugar epimerase